MNSGFGSRPNHNYEENMVEFDLKSWSDWVCIHTYVTGLL
jgi:hypothetical protein